MLWLKPSHSTISVQSSSNVCNTKPRSTKFQIRRRSQCNSKLKFHTLTEKIITGVKFYIKQPRCLLCNKVQYNTKPCYGNKLTLGKGSQTTRKHTTTKRRVLHDPATHHTSEGLSYMTQATEPQKNSQPKVSLEHYVGDPTQLSYS